MEWYERKLIFISTEAYEMMQEKDWKHILFRSKNIA